MKERAAASRALALADVLIPVMGVVYVALGAYVLLFRPLTRVLGILGAALVANGVMYLIVHEVGEARAFRTLAGIATIVLFAVFYGLFPRPVRPWTPAGVLIGLTFVWGAIDLGCVGAAPSGWCRTLNPGIAGNLLLVSIMLARLIELPATPDRHEQAARLLYLAPIGIAFGGGAFTLAWALWGSAGGASYPEFAYAGWPLHTAVAQVLTGWVLPLAVIAVSLVRWRWWPPAAVFLFGAASFVPSALAGALEPGSVRVLTASVELLTPWFLVYAQATWSPFEGEPGGRRTVVVLAVVAALVAYASVFILSLLFVRDPVAASVLGSTLGLVAAGGMVALVVPRARRAALLRSFGDTGGTPHDALAPGRVILGRYRIERLLAEGGQGRVYEARDRQRQDARVVLKATTSDDAAREARILRDLRHPNIVRLVELVEGPGVTLLVLGYAEGGSLRGLLARRRGAIPPVEGLALARGILAGLAAAHAQGVTHRDVKPENVLLDARGVPMLADFGAARDHRPGATVQVAGLGTLRYLAPEQLRGEAGDARTDVYAAAVVVHEMLSGQPPVPLPDDDFLARRAILMQPPRIVVPIEAAAIAPLLERALAKAPAARYADAREMLAALEGARERVTDAG